MWALGLDPSLTAFGWAIHNSKVVGRERVVARGVLSTPAKAVFVWRYMYLRQAVSEILDAYPEVTRVGVESPPFGEQWSEGLYGLYLYVTEALFTHRVDVVFFDPSRVKSLARGDGAIRRGRMEKRDMIEAARADTTIKGWDHNEADAYLVARSAARFWDFLDGNLKEDELTPSELTVFLATHKFTRGEKAGRTVRRGIVFKEGDRFHQFSMLKPNDTTVPSSIVTRIK